MKILVTGVNGQLGHDVVNELSGRGLEAVGSDITENYSGIPDGSAICAAAYRKLDITDREAVLETVHETAPDALIHCAAWTAVDAAEDPLNRDRVFDINVNGTKYLAEACREADIPMLYISTDYVFNGQGTSPWDPDCKEYEPLCVYGASKLGGELAVSETLRKFFIVRIAWVFGLNGKNFVRTMLNAGRKFPELRVVNDQIGTPTYTLDLARLLADMIVTDRYGYYHATNEGGYISWYDFTLEIFRQAGIHTKVTPVTTAEYGLSKAARPFNSRLDRSKLPASGFAPLPPWQDALKRFLQEIGELKAENNT